MVERLRGFDALRAKGFVRTAEGLCAVQGVGPRITVSPTRIPVPDALVGTVVLIAREPA